MKRTKPTAHIPSSELLTRTTNDTD